MFLDLKNLIGVFLLMVGLGFYVILCVFNIFYEPLEQEIQEELNLNNRFITGSDIPLQTYRESDVIWKQRKYQNGSIFIQRRFYEAY